MQLDDYSQISLHQAASNGDYDLVMMLLQTTIDINIGQL